MSRVSPVQTALRNCTRDEGRSFEDSQVLASNRCKLLSVTTIVVSVAVNVGRKPGLTRPPCRREPQPGFAGTAADSALGALHGVSPSPRLINAEVGAGIPHRISLPLFPIGNDDLRHYSSLTLMLPLTVLPSWTVSADCYPKDFGLRFEPANVGAFAGSSTLELQCVGRS